MRALARAPPVRRSGALAGGRLIHSDGRHGLIMASPSSVVRCLRYPDSAAAAHFANFGGDWAKRGGGGGLKKTTSNFGALVQGYGGGAVGPSSTADRTRPRVPCVVGEWPVLRQGACRATQPTAP